MQKAPKIALFLPEDAEEEIISRLFIRSTYVLKKISSPLELTKFIEGPADYFDAIVLPLRLKEGISGITTCLKLKSHPVYCSCPVIMLSTSVEKAVLEACYGAGSDVVFIPPFNATLLFFQISACARFHRSFEEQLEATQNSSNLDISSMTAFDAVREGIVVFDRNKNPVFINLQGQALLKADPNSELCLEICRQFQPLIDNHLHNIANSLVSSTANTRISLFETDLKQSDQQSFKAAVRVCSILSGPKNLLGFSVSITDLSEIFLLGNILMQSERTRTLGLLTSCVSRQLLREVGIKGSPSRVDDINYLLEQEDYSCNVGEEITAILEFIDLVINPSTSLRVKIDDEGAKLRVKPSHFFQVVAHMLLHAVEYAGSGGETALSLSIDPADGEATVLVVSESFRVTPPIPNDHLSGLLVGDFSSLENNVGSKNKLLFGLSAAQRIADMYKTYVEVKSNEKGLKIRIKLPLIVEEI